MVSPEICVNNLNFILPRPEFICQRAVSHRLIIVSDFWEHMVSLNSNYIMWLVSFQVLNGHLVEVSNHNIYYLNVYAYTHTHTHIYIYILVFDANHFIRRFALSLTLVGFIVYYKPAPHSYFWLFCACTHFFVIIWLLLKEMQHRSDEIDVICTITFMWIGYDLNNNAFLLWIWINICQYHMPCSSKLDIFYIDNLSSTS